MATRQIRRAGACPPPAFHLLTPERPAIMQLTLMSEIAPAKLIVTSTK
jgi:hypothetical protein